MVTLFNDFVACEGRANVSSVVGKDAVDQPIHPCLVCVCGESVNVLKSVLTCFSRFLQTTSTTSETRLERSRLESVETMKASFGKRKKVLTTRKITHIHSHTDGRVNHARRQPDRPQQLGLGVLLRDTSTLS